MKSQHVGQGVVAPPVARSAAPDTVEHMLSSVPALRRAGLDELADSIETMAREVGVGAEADAPAAGGPGDTPVTPEPSAVGALVGRSRLGLGATIVVMAAALGRVWGVVGRIGRSARHRLVRRREFVWGALVVSSMSLLVGWVITRLP